MVFFNIEKREEARKKNKIFLEKLLILGQKIKTLQVIEILN
jgi:hypothetical protein